MPSFVTSKHGTKYDGKLVFHRFGCPYVKRIKHDNLQYIDLNDAMDRDKYVPCKYCRGVRGEVRTRKGEIESWERNMNLTIIRKGYHLYIKTESGGFWKIVCSYDSSYIYVLYHCNHYSKGAIPERMMYWKFHRQTDVPATPSLKRLVTYIYNHDEAKKIMDDDYTKLPTKTKKEKKFYKRAERREERKAARRMDKLFDQIEKEMNIKGG